jgi:hypothetical protein
MQKGISRQRRSGDDVSESKDAQVVGFTTRSNVVYGDQAAAYTRESCMQRWFLPSSEQDRILISSSSTYRTGTYM